MTDVFVERHWEKPLTEADMQSLFETAGGCLETHRCVWQGSLLSVDGRELFCHFTAPDAESVRIAMLQAGLPRGVTWPGTIQDAPEFNEALLAKANVVVARRFDEPVDIAAIQAVEDAGAGCLQAHRVRFLRTFFSTDRRRMMCLYHAPDAESVRIAQREARMPVERVWAFRQYRP